MAKTGISSPGSGTDAAAIHDDAASEIHALTEKTTPVDADELVIEDSAASYAKKRLQISNLPAGSSDLATTAEVTLYVAKTGNDENAGTSGSPKLTIQGALDALPAIIAHDCIVNVSPGTYTETPDFSRFIIPASLTVQAVDTADREWFQLGTATGGSSTTIIVEDADVVSDDEWNGGYVAIYDGTGEGQIREITDTTGASNTLTVAAWETNAAAGSKYVLGGAVEVSGTGRLLTLENTQNLIFYGISFVTSDTGTYDVTVGNTSRATFYDCFFVAKYCVVVGGFSSAYFGHCGFKPAAAGQGCMVQDASGVTLWESVFYGAKSTDYGLYSQYGASVTIYTDTQVRHCATGVYATGGGIVIGPLTYTDNTTNAIPNAWTASEHLDALASDGFAYISDVT